MPTRRAFLQSVAALPLAPALISCMAHAHQELPVEPYFILYSKLWRGIDLKRKQSPFPFQLTEGQIRRAIDNVVVAMQDEDMSLPPIAARNVERIAGQIVRKVDKVVAATNYPAINKFSQQWLIAEGVCEWVRLNVRYDAGIERLSGDEQVRRAEPEVVLAQPTPGAVCFGNAWLTRDLARAAGKSIGLKCDVVNGYYRGLKNPPPSGPNHSVVCFVFEGGIEVPTDAGSGRSDFPPKTKIAERFILPRSPEAWELFLAGFFAREDAVQTAFDVQGKHRFVQMSLSQWQYYDPAVLIPLAEAMERTENQRAKPKNRN